MFTTTMFNPTKSHGLVLLLLACYLGLPACDGGKTTDADAAPATDEPSADGNEDATKTPAKPAGPPIVGAADEIKSLREAFASDHTKADAEHANRKIKVSGKVSMTISDESLRMNETGKPGKGDLTCYTEAVPDGVEVGTDIEIEGTINGTVGNIVGGNIWIKDCSIKVL